MGDKPQVSNNNDAAEKKDSSFFDGPREALHAAAYSIQMAANGVVQDVSHAIVEPLTNKRLKQIDLLDAPTKTDVGSGMWAWQTVGGGVGMALPFIVSSRIAEGGGKLMFGKAGAEFFEGSSASSWAVRGAVYEGLFHPINSDADFSMQKGKNMLAGAVGFGAFGGTVNTLKDITPIQNALTGGKLMTRIASGIGLDAVGGAVGGTTDTAARALMDGKLPTAYNLGSNALQWAVMASAAHGFRAIAGREEPYRNEIERNEMKAALGAGTVKYHGDVYANLGEDATTGDAVLVAQHAEPAPDAQPVTVTVQDLNNANLFHEVNLDPEVLDKLRTFESQPGNEPIPDAHIEPEDVLVQDTEGHVFWAHKAGDKVQLIPDQKIVMAHMSNGQAPWAPLTSDNTHHSVDERQKSAQRFNIFEAPTGTNQPPVGPLMIPYNTGKANQAPYMVSFKRATLQR